jgi:hypothetical protein
MCEGPLATAVQDSSSAPGCHAQLIEARLTGVHLAARELAHMLNNDLTPAVIVFGLLQDESQLPVEMRRPVSHAAAYLDRALMAVAQLQRVVRVETRETPQGPALDLVRSSETRD